MKIVGLSFIVLVVAFFDVDCQYPPVSYIGCYNDIKAYRDIPFVFSSGSMTPDYCISTCRNLSLPFAALQYSMECYCGSSYGKYGKADEKKCNFYCLGDTSKYCGGLDANSIWLVTYANNSAVPSYKNEWGLVINQNFLKLQTDSIRLFDFITGTVYMSANYMPSANKIEIGMIVNNTYYRNSLVFNSALNPITSMAVAWKSPQFIVLINCQLAGTINFTAPDQIYYMSLPLLMPNKLISENSTFSPTLYDTLLKINCLDNNSIVKYNSTVGIIKAMLDSISTTKDVQFQLFKSLQQLVLDYNTFVDRLKNLTSLIKT